MPNWCSNNVRITHDDPAVLKALAESVHNGKFLNHIIPVPKELTETVAGHCGDGYAQELNQFKMELNKKYFGAKDWYDFCVSRWGTKWEVEAYDKDSVLADKGVLEFGFDSAWSPPLGVYEEMLEQGFDVVAYYYEPGMGYVGKWDNGYDDCYEYSGYTSKTVVDYIGEELDDMFGISESMAEFEEENKEEVTQWYEQGVEELKLENK